MPESVRNIGFTKLNSNYLLTIATRPKQSHYYIIYHAGQGWRAHQEVQLVPLESPPGREHAEERGRGDRWPVQGGRGECGTIGQLERGSLTAAALGWSRSTLTTLIKWRPSTVRRSTSYCNSVSPEVYIQRPV